MKVLLIMCLAADPRDTHINLSSRRSHHGCGFVTVGAPYVLLTFRRVVSIGGWSTAQVDVGVSRVCCRLLSRCLLLPGCSLDQVADARIIQLLQSRNLVFNFLCELAGGA